MHLQGSVLILVVLIVLILQIHIEIGKLKVVKTKHTSSFSLSAFGASLPRSRIMVWRAKTFLISGRRTSTISLKRKRNLCKISLKSTDVNNNTWSKTSKWYLTPSFRASAFWLPFIWSRAEAKMDSVFSSKSFSLSYLRMNRNWGQ